MKKKKNKKTLIAKFNNLGRAICPNCLSWMHPFMLVRCEGKNNIFKCECKKIVKVIYPGKKHENP